VFQGFFGPVLEDGFYFGHELVGQGAVDQAVVEAEREVADRADRDGVVDYYRGFVDRADADDRDLRLVDYGGADQATETAEVGDGECPADYFVGLELAGAGARGEVDDGALQAEDVLLVGGADDGDDEAVFESDRNADVDLVVVDDVVAVERGVEERVLAKGGDTGARDEGEVGQREAVRRLEIGFVALAHFGNLGHVDAVHGGDVRGGALRQHHVLGDLLAHGAEGLDARLGCRGQGPGAGGRGNFGGRGRRRDFGGRGYGLRRGLWDCGSLRLREIGFDVLFRDAAAGAGAFHFGEIDVVFSGELAD
jgi:hypothetical protein